MKHLPLSIRTFGDFYELDYLYVDKTKQIHELFARGGKYYEKYLGNGKEIVLMGIGFGPEDRNIGMLLK